MEGVVLREEFHRPSDTFQAVGCFEGELKLKLYVTFQNNRTVIFHYADRMYLFASRVARAIR